MSTRRHPPGWREEQFEHLAAERAPPQRVNGSPAPPASLPLVVKIDDYLPPALNGTGGLMRMHWAQTDRALGTAQMRLRVALGPPPHPRFEVPVRAKFWRVRTSGPPMDRDNALSSWKLLGDALQKIGILENDKLIEELHVGQGRGPKRATVIFVGPFEMQAMRTCRRCWCTESDCRQCVARTGRPCTWVERDICSACVEP